MSEFEKMVNEQLYISKKLKRTNNRSTAEELPSSTTRPMWQTKKPSSGC